MSKPINIVDLITNNPLAKLSRPYQSKLINKIKHAFTCEEQQLFVASFYCYLNYDSKNDFVIDFDDIWQWLGFSRKDHAKRLLESVYTVNADYKVALPRAGERKNEGGFNREVILLSVKTFKSFCLKAKTDKASQIHEYYIKLEEILHELLDEESSELRQQLSATQTLLKSTEHALEVEKDKYKNAMRRKYYNEEPGDIIYVYANSLHEQQPLLKIGKTTNISERENSFNTCNVNGGIVYTKRCYNCDILEKVIHHVLDKHRVYKQKEWFQIPFTVAKEVVDTCHLILDQLIPHVDYLPQVGFFNNLQNMVGLLKSENVEELNNFTQLENEVLQTKSDMYQQLDQRKQHDDTQLDTVIVNTNKQLQSEDIINPLDFDRFIKEACEVGDDVHCLKADLYGAHKMWSRNAESGTKKKVFEYFEEHFRSDKLYYEEHQAKLAVWKGIRPKTPTFSHKDPANPTQFEKFVMERCKLGHTYRTSYKCIFSDYEEWMKSINSAYNLSIDERRNLQNYLNNTFFACSVYLASELKDAPGGGANNHGVWGITLKTDNTHVGIKLSNKLRKKIVSVDVATKKIVKVYNSGVEAARDLGTIASIVSHMIKFKKPRNGLLLRRWEEGDSVIDE